MALIVAAAGPFPVHPVTNRTQSTRIRTPRTEPTNVIWAIDGSVDDIGHVHPVDSTVLRALDLLDVVVPGIRRWDGTQVTPDDA